MRKKITISLCVIVLINSSGCEQSDSLEQTTKTFKPTKADTISSTNKLPKSNLALNIAHQNKRFHDLDIIMAKDKKYHLKFPGTSAQKHALGTGIARSSWPAQEHQEIINNISNNITKLAKKYPNRISFGYIGDYKLDASTGNCDRALTNSEGVPGEQIDGTFIVHVWGANAGNFNLENEYPGSFGAGQASCFSKQRAGVFGISTMPSSDEATLLADDKLLSSY